MKPARSTLAFVISAIIAAGCGTSAAPSASLGSTDPPVASATAVASGSQPSPAFDPATAGDVNLKFWYSEIPSRAEIITQRIREYEAKYPNVSVEIVMRDFASFSAQVKLALSSNDPPDLASGNLGWSLDGPLVKAGLIRDLTPYVERYGWDERYPENAFRQFSFTPDGKIFGQGNVFGLPYAADVTGWFYNPEKLAALGQTVPTTLSEFESTMDAIKAAGEQPIIVGNKEGYAALGIFSMLAAATPIAQFEGLVYGDTSVSWTDQPFIDAMTKLQDWVAKGYINADAPGLGNDDSVAMFAQGAAVFKQDGTWSVPPLDEAMDGNVGFFLPPAVEEGAPRPSVGSFGIQIHIATKSKNPDVAASLLDWITAPETASLFAGVGDIPAVASDATPTNATKATLDAYKAFADASAAGELLPYLDWATPNAFEVDFPIFSELLAGQTTPLDAATRLEANRRTFMASQQ